MNYLKQFGGKISDENIKEYSRSKHWDGKHFNNLVKTTLDIQIKDWPYLIKNQLNDRASRGPEKPIPVIPFDIVAWNQSSEKFQFIWYGHSVLLIKLGGLNILIDPMFGSNASPIAPFKTSRFSENTLGIIKNLPEIDLVLLSHDHYDHLDMDSILMLKGKTKRYIVAFGVARHLIRWGVDPNSIQEMDWWEKVQLENDVDITFTPTRHFSGRGIHDRFKSFWGGWALHCQDLNIWFSGDGGDGGHFIDIADRLGPFDFTWIECGQYNELWKQIHLMPECSASIAKAVNSSCAMPVHWGAFSLAMHPWTEPVERFIEAANLASLNFITPRIGEMIVGSELTSKDSWWES